MTGIPLWLNLTLLFSPLLFSTTISLWINILLRRINRQEGGQAWTIKKNFLMALIVSSPLAGLISLLLQGQLESYIYIQNKFHLIIFDMIVAPFAVLILQNFLLYYFSKKGSVSKENNWNKAYYFIRVKHDKTLPAEYYADDVSDFTIKNYRKDSSLNNNDIKEE